MALSTDLQTEYLQLQRDISITLVKLSEARSTISRAIDELEEVYYMLPLPQEETKFKNHCHQLNLSIQTAQYKIQLNSLRHAMRMLTELGIVSE